MSGAFDLRSLQLEVLQYQQLATGQLALRLAFVGGDDQIPTEALDRRAERLLNADKRPVRDEDAQAWPADPVPQARLPAGSGTTFTGGSACRKRRISSAQISAMRTRASPVEPPMCGVTITFGRPRSSSRSPGGSSSRTSSAAPRSRPFRRASSTALSSITGPRARLSRYEPGFMARTRSAFRSCTVVESSGT